MGLHSWGKAGLCMYDLITINGGHSARSTGASGCGYKEHQETRNLKNEVISCFKQVGQKYKDTTSDKSNQQAVLDEQIHLCNVNPVKGRLDVSIHFNGGSSIGTGTEVYYYTEKQLASHVSSLISKEAGWRDRGAKQNKGLYFLKHTTAPSILIEVCFITNCNDMKIYEKKRKALAETICYALTGKHPSTDTTKLYVVKKGDTLYSIAKDHHTTVDKLVKANNIKDKNLIHPGQKLMIK